VVTMALLLWPHGHHGYDDCMATDFDLGALLALAKSTAVAAGELLDEGSRVERQYVSTKSSSTDMVTEMDHASEELILSRILEMRPSDSVVTEERAHIEGSSDVCWVIDPLDGTTNYLYGFASYAVSIAATAYGRSIVGVVYDVPRHELFTAVAGKGARKNGELIKPSGQTDLSMSLVGTGFDYEANGRRRQAEVLVTVLPRVRDIRRGGAAAVDLCAVACGRLDAFFEKHLRPWDFAAGVLIAEESGCLVGDLTGHVPSTDCTLVATPEIFEQLRSLILETHCSNNLTVVSHIR
jgi:myo-inositol-1(or 4)-monophosphatase